MSVYLCYLDIWLAVKKNEFGSRPETIAIEGAGAARGVPPNKLESWLEIMIR